MLSTETIQVMLTALGPLSFLTSILLFRILRNLIKSTVFSWGSEFKNAVFDEIVKNPEIFMPLAQSFLKKFAQPGNAPKSLKLFGIPIPGEIVSQVMQFGMGKLMGGVKEAGTEAAASVQW